MVSLLGIDVSTTGAKALLIDERGEVMASATTEYPLTSPRPMWSEQNPADWWHGVQVSVQAVLSKAGLRGSEVVGVGLTGQMHGLVLLDAQDQVLRPAILWNDQRTGAQCEEIIRRAGGLAQLLKHTGNTVLPGFTAPKLLWVRQHEPEVYARVSSFLLPKDYVRLCLTGEHATDVSDASGTSLLDVKQRRWSQSMIDLLDIPRSWLPACVESTEVAGWITPEVGKATGLQAGTPVIAGGGDQAAQAVGTGVVRGGIISVTLGTSGVVFAHSDHFVAEAEGRLHAFCHAVPGKWHLMGVMLSAGGSFRWLRDTVCLSEKHLASLGSKDPYDLLTCTAASAPAGSDGLIFLPYLTGERTPYPDPQARGAFVGLTTRHGRGHLIRSVMEGVSFGLRDCLELVRALGVPIAQVRGSGGGVRSALWRQILADVFGTELAQASVTEGAAFGAALLAGVGTGVFHSVEDAVDRTILVTQVTSPVPENQERYERLYPIYRSLYPALTSAFSELAQQG